ncbi:MAG: hypothetical protein KDK62_07760 [Chlamydiia bacterium]|nr:hypothetical protein [Chlamydiia bacterium]
MKKSIVSKKSKRDPEANIFANKSGLILHWLLTRGIEQKTFKLREIASDCDVSLGLVQKVLTLLIKKGIVKTVGVRTSKQFMLDDPTRLLEEWVENYDITKKCRITTFDSGFSGRTKLLDQLKKSDLVSKVALCLHTAADAYGYKHTNLETLELYLLDPGAKDELLALLDLEPQESGYKVLIVEPYYKSLLETTQSHKKKFLLPPPLLTYLDLYHFPLRGIEQAEYLAENHPEIKRIQK